MDVTLLRDTRGRPAFAVLPYAEYLQLMALATGARQQEEHPMPQRHIALPHSGGATLDLARFISYWQRFNIVRMPVGARAQRYDRFPTEQLNSLDPVLRRVFLPSNSPYKNTMQAVSSVVDALIATGIFHLTVAACPGYYRPVQVLEINNAKANAYLEDCGNPPAEFDDDALVI